MCSMKMRSLFLCVVFFFLTFAVTGCLFTIGIPIDTTGEALPTDVFIDFEGDVIVPYGTHVEFSALVSPTNANQDVNWSVDNPDVAIISQTGVFSAIGEGTVKVIATSTNAPSVSAFVTFTVLENDFGLSISERNELALVFDTMTFDEKVDYVKNFIALHQGDNGILKDHEIFIRNIQFLNVTVKWKDVNQNELTTVDDIDSYIIPNVGLFLTHELNIDGTFVTYDKLYCLDNYMNINNMRYISAFDLIKEMEIGWSLGNTFDAWDSQAGFNSNINETSWGNPVTTKAMFDEIKAKGFNVIRIGVTWYGHFDEVTYEIDPAWLDRVEQVVHYALDGGETFAVINTHHETSWATSTDSNLQNACTILEALWTQIANRFKNYNEYLIFTGLGEPRMVGHPDEWAGNPEGFNVVNILNSVFINAVKSTGGNNFSRTLLIPTYAASGNLAAIQALANGFQTGMIPNNNSVAVTVDCYIPYDFALSWTGGTSNWSRLNPSDTLLIDNLMFNLNDYFVSQNIGVVISEFGARDRQNTSNRIDWATYYIESAKQFNIPCIWWDTGANPTPTTNTFCIFDRNNLTWHFPTLVDSMIQSAYQ